MIKIMLTETYELFEIQRELAQKFGVIYKKDRLPNPEETEVINDLNSRSGFCIMDLDCKKRLLENIYRWAGGIGIAFTILALIHYVAN